MITPSLRELKLSSLPSNDRGAPTSRPSSTPPGNANLDAAHKFSNPISLISKKGSFKNSSNSSLPSMTEIKNQKPEVKQRVSTASVIPTATDNGSRKPGLSFLPSQCEKISTVNGGNLTILLVGERGTGKTSFINTLFGSELINGEAEDTGDNESISVHRFELVEDHVKLDLRVIETVDYGNSFNRHASWITLSKYVDDQFKSYLYQSQQPKRATMVDSRIHCCIYFLNSVTRLISNLDIQSMKSLSTKANLLPVIARADMLTDVELNNFKKLLSRTLREYHIRICENLPSSALLQKVELMVPFVIVSSLEKHENKNGKLVRARKYPWSMVEIENVLHCDFIYLRKLLLIENTLEFVASTEVYYEQFRCSYLTRHLIKNGEYDATNNVLNGLEQLMMQQQDQIVELIGNNGNADSQIIGMMEQQVNYRLTKYRKEQESRLRSWKVHLVDEQEKLQKELHTLADQRNQLQKAIDEYYHVYEVEELQDSSETYKNGTDENQTSITPSVVSEGEEVSPQLE
ncbi:Sporulation-regulated protein 3 [Candida viswanathii]|uniref:Sporulation-regulated protein 3 n=1 Tax=Candida viswanathii TaxID=5486 RepID=A0A367XNS7_9ASCO|nr:Sporulation-regulated protein 3 [Candida viswanathii]